MPRVKVFLCPGATGIVRASSEQPSAQRFPKPPPRSRTSSRSLRGEKEESHMLGFRFVRAHRVHLGISRRRDEHRAHRPGAGRRQRRGHRHGGQEPAGQGAPVGIILGAGGAVVIRVICTFLVAQLLNMPFVKLIGGAVIIWIAVKLLTEGAKEECHGKECGSLWQALWIIIVADLSMGIDNMLAVGRRQPRQPVPAALRPGPLDPVRGVHEHLALQADGPLPDHPLDRRGDAGQGGRRNDDHRPLGRRTAATRRSGSSTPSMVFFVIFVCLLSKWIISDRPSKAAPQEFAAMEPAATAVNRKAAL